MKVKIEYYQNFCKTDCKEISAAGYAGWQQGEIEINPQKSAIVVMHTWDTTNYKNNKSWYRAAEWLKRADEILNEKFPAFLKTVRESNIEIIHVASAEYYCDQYPAYQRIKQKWPVQAIEQVDVADDTLQTMRQYLTDHSYCGKDNQADINKIFKDELRFSPLACPIENESIVVSSNQLFHLCKEKQINHLIYTGFCINWCLQSSPCGMVDMSKHGFMCSTVKDLVTAVENAETVNEELCKQLALWRVSLEYGFVLDLQDLTIALRNK